MAARYFKIILFIIVFQLAACQSKVSVKPSGPAYTGPIPAGQWLRDLRVEYMVGDKKKSVQLQIYFPKNYQKGAAIRTLIGLHGFKGHYMEWERATGIEQHADKYDFIIVCPDMGATLYELQFYPETTMKWNSIPGGKWIAEILVPYLRSTFGIARDRKTTGIFGYSTGARGALLIAASYPELFGVAAGISGDYDPLTMTGDKLLTAVYGKYGQFKSRWETDANIVHKAQSLKDTPIFLAHGEIDKVVPLDQTRILIVRLLQLRKSTGGSYKFEYIQPKYKGHGWPFCSSVVSPMMSYLNDNL